jgi:hypothetical protein
VTPVQIGVVCQSSTINPVDLAFIVQAWDAQSKEFCAAWGIPYIPVVLYSPPPADQVGTGEVRLMTIEDTLDVDGALGYHTDELGDIFARILAENNADSGSHECCEESLDPTVDVWKPIGDGREIAFEACDPVEGDSYSQDATIGEGPDAETRQVPVTNYVLPSYFDPNGKAPFDRMGKLTAPFTMDDGGYMVVRDAAGNESDVFAGQAHVEHGGERGRLAAEKKRARPDSRLSRRLAAKRPPLVLNVNASAGFVAGEGLVQPTISVGNEPPAYETQVPMPERFRSDASSPPMPWGPGPRPEGYVDAPRPVKPDDEPPPSTNLPPAFG